MRIPGPDTDDRWVEPFFHRYRRDCYTPFVKRRMTAAWGAPDCQKKRNRLRLMERRYQIGGGT